MKIQWYPGHMAKALRMMDDNIKQVDIVGYVLDARAPFSCFNPSFSKLTNGKPCVFVLNKCDLADDEKVNKWKNFFSSEGKTCVTVSATKLNSAKQILSAMKQISDKLNSKFKAKGIFKPLRAMIIGVPNSGKSSIINCLCGRKATVTGDRPGVTKGKQWVRLSNGLELLDTPGTLWSKFEEQKVAQRLCFVGSIKDDIVDIYEVAILLIEELLNQYPDMLKSRFVLDSVDVSPQEILESIAKKRGYLLSGGELDLERTAKAILLDFRSGKIGKITLDNLGD